MATPEENDAAWKLSTWAASIDWTGTEPNTREWLLGLRERIERVQAVFTPSGKSMTTEGHKVLDESPAARERDDAFPREDVPFTRVTSFGGERGFGSFGDPAVLELAGRGCTSDVMLHELTSGRVVPHPMSEDAPLLRRDEPFAFSGPETEGVGVEVPMPEDAPLMRASRGESFDEHALAVADVLGLHPDEPLATPEGARDVVKLFPGTVPLRRRSPEERRTRFWELFDRDLEADLTRVRATARRLLDNGIMLELLTIDEDLKKAREMPIDMVLFCPVCGLQHVDAPEPAKGWENPPHRSHLCHGCSHVWRPAGVPTNGVLDIALGERDTRPPVRRGGGR